MQGNAGWEGKGFGKSSKLNPDYLFIYLYLISNFIGIFNLYLYWDEEIQNLLGLKVKTNKEIYEQLFYFNKIY